MFNQTSKKFAVAYLFENLIITLNTKLISKCQVTNAKTSRASGMHPLCVRTQPMLFAAEMFVMSLFKTVLYIVRARSWCCFAFFLSLDGVCKVWSQTLPRAMSEYESFAVAGCYQ